MRIQAIIAHGLPVALAGTVLLGGCAGLAPEVEPQSIGADQSVIRFQHEDFDSGRAEYFLHHDPRSANDMYVAQFVGRGAFATLAAFKTGPSHVIEERSVESYVGNLLQDSELTWGEAGRAETGMGRVPYRMFGIAGQPVSCVGFGQPRGESSDDRGRKSDLLFGFFCQSDARPMSAATASDLISKVSLTGRR
jgi:hypothetical protein